MRNTSSLLRRGLVGFAVTALAFAALGTAEAQASVAKAPTIETYSSWDGSSYVSDFGCPDTSVYGQTFTVPEGSSKFTKITWPWENLDTGSMVVRGYVYAWNGTMATGKKLAKTKPQTIDFSDGVFHDVTFKFIKSKALTVGAQYVVFASIDKDYSKCVDNYEVGWGLVTSGDPYTGGGFVYQNNGGDMSQWTTQPWSSFGTTDVAFKAYLK